METIGILFNALADQTRREILGRLAHGERTVNELTEAFELSQPTISSHLKVLEQAGLVDRRVDGNRRPARLSKGGFVPVQEWIGTIAETMETNYARLDALLEEDT